MHEVRFVEPGSPEHQEALDLRTAAFFLDHGGRPAAEARDVAGADHPVILDGGRVVACGQGHLDGDAYHISQMAVKEGSRLNGLGTAILLALLAVAEDLGVECRLEARAHVVDFYARHGFVAVSAARPIGETGVPHVAMVRPPSHTGQTR